MRARPFSLVFRIGPWPVVVEPMFWFVCAILGMQTQPARMVGWILICFLSVLLHELGHAAVAGLFGARSVIRLHGFGGTTHLERALGRWRDLAMSLAGPFAGFAAGALVWAAARAFPPHLPLLIALVQMALWINLGWGLMNLVPVLPLDGGHVLVSLVGPKHARWVKPLSLAAAALGAGLGLWINDPYLAVFFAFLGVLNLQPERGLAAQKPRRKSEIEGELAQGWAALSAGDEHQAEHFARSAVTSAQTPEALNRARDLLAWVLLAQADGSGALRQLEQVRPAEAARALSWALAYESIDAPDRALPYARRALAEEPSLTSAKLAFRLALVQGEPAFAAQVAQGFAWPNPGERDAKLAEVALAEGRPAEAIARAEAAFGAAGRAEDAVLAARAHAGLGETDAALEWLSRAESKGAALDEALEAKELSPLRDDPRLAARAG